MRTRLVFAWKVTYNLSNGKINAFIIYVNAVVDIYANSLFLLSNIELLMKFLNLDVGIEVCFYHGMTKYNKTWLQFTFPSYLFFTIGVAAFANTRIVIPI